MHQTSKDIEKIRRQRDEELDRFLSDDSTYVHKCRCAHLIFPFTLGIILGLAILWIAGTLRIG